MDDSPDFADMNTPRPLAPGRNPMPVSVVLLNVGLTTLFQGALLAARAFGGDPLPVLGGMFVAAVVAPLVARRVRRAREVAVLESIRGGASLVDADWIGARDVVQNSFAARRLPMAVFTIYLMVVAGLITFGIGQVMTAAAPRHTAVLLSIPFVALALLLVWVHVRGGVQVRLDRFPYRPGERMRVFVATTPGAPHIDGAWVALRCIRREPRRGLRRPPLDFVLWSRATSLAARPGPDEFIDVDLGEIPPHLPGTFLHAAASVRWEIRVEGRTQWGWIAETVVVPVYAAG
ncbi:MAG: hypothetical protein K8T90_06275 [Planctomycetes bacterium]|nr:hypothetical protein [Planctomycetota bacterium]